MQDIRICSLKEVSQIFHRPLAQVQILDRARVLGQAYSNGAGSRYYLDENIHRIAQAPRYNKTTLSAAIQSASFPSDIAVILRQIAPQPADDGVRQWFGFDLSAEESEDPQIRKQQDDASRMWWPISSTNLARVRDLKAGEFIPMFVTVGGMIVAGRNITGIDEELTAQQDNLVAFTVEDAGSWFDQFRFNWLSSGPGKAILWW